MPKRDQIGESYLFLTSRERASEPFSLEELCEATGWSIGTPRTYLTKRWPQWVAKVDDRYRTSGLVAIGEDEYRLKTVGKRSMKRIISAVTNEGPVTENSPERLGIAEVVDEDCVATVKLAPTPKEPQTE